MGVSTRGSADRARICTLDRGRPGASGGFCRLAVGVEGDGRVSPRYKARAVQGSRRTQRFRRGTSPSDPNPQMPFSVLDLVVLGIVVISALLAAVRGVTREVLAIIAWVAAAAVAWSLYPMLLPTVKQHVTSDTVALVASIAAIFLGTLIVVSIITVKISGRGARLAHRRDRPVARLPVRRRPRLPDLRDRLGCFCPGWCRGKVPTWAAEARSRPMLEKSGDALVAQLPENPEGFPEAVQEAEGGHPAERAGRCTR